jgi:hypothetical protein
VKRRREPGSHHSYFHRGLHAGFSLSIAAWPERGPVRISAPRVGEVQYPGHRSRLSRRDWAMWEKLDDLNRRANPGANGKRRPE